MKHPKRTILTVALFGVLATGLMPANALALENSAAAYELASVPATSTMVTEAPDDGIVALASNPLGPKISREDALAAMSAFEDAYPRFTTIYDVTP